MSKRREDLARLERLAAQRDPSVDAIVSGGPPPPDDIEAFTADWCTEALTASGVLDGARVVDVRSSSLGPDTPGFFGRLCRLAIAYDRPAAGPSTVVAKTNSPAEFNRAIAHRMGMYEREYRFYRELARTIPLRLPAHYYSAIEDDRFVLLMQDLGEGRVGQQSEPASLIDIEAILDEIALLHARFSGGGAGADEIAWLEPIDANAAIFAASFETRWPGFVTHFSDTVSPAIVEVGDRIVGRVPEVLAALARGPATVVHGDFRIDNIVFDMPPDVDRPMIIDWQSLARGHGVFDVACIIALSLDPDVREAAERQLLDRYAETLEALTGAPVSRDELYEGYRLALVYPFVMGVAQSDLSKSEQGSDVGVWVARASRALLENGLPSSLR